MALGLVLFSFSERPPRDRYARRARPGLLPPVGVDVFPDRDPFVLKRMLREPAGSSRIEP